MVENFKSEGGGHYGRIILPPAISMAKKMPYQKFQILRFHLTMPGEIALK